MPELATDTPLPGSDQQIIHRDFPLRSPYLPELAPTEPFQFAVNFPLVPVTIENGPFEIAPGTHLWEDAEAKARIKAGEVEPRLIPLLMEVGDVMIRDVRTLHRGTPNRTDRRRTMVVVGYNRARHLRPQLRIFVPRAALEAASTRARRLLRLNPVVERLEDAPPQETYSDLDFLKLYDE
jgi:ectoine hydroxylase-related dioxygenase (phytanoyl-CoA dioxygenase family)